MSTTVKNAGRYYTDVSRFCKDADDYLAGGHILQSREAALDYLIRSGDRLMSESYRAAVVSRFAVSRRLAKLKQGGR